MTLELIIFLIVAAVAIFAAAFMLVSRNAVHSALFLVTNMICLAFMYLLLNAPFLAMVQITVYAGAIMVLFMFVIMLLGAEKLGEQPTRYKWLPIAGVGLVTLFLVTAYFAIAQGNVGALKPIAKAPQVRVVHVGQGVPPVTVYLNNDKVTDSVGYGTASSYREVRAGDYNLLVFASTNGLTPNPATDSPALAQPISLRAETTTTIIATADRLIIVPEDLNTIDAVQTVRYTVVNALPTNPPINFISIDPANPNPAPEDRSKYITILAPALPYGEFSRTTTLPAGKYRVAWEINNQRVNAPAELDARENTSQLIVLYPEAGPAGSPTGRSTELVLANHTASAFGGPNNIGETLFTTYLLPFELVSLLLLVAMVGAIILTREETVKRERKRVVVSNSAGVRRLNQASASAMSLTEHKKPSEGAAD